MPAYVNTPSNNAKASYSQLENTFKSNCVHYKTFTFKLFDNLLKIYDNKQHLGGLFIVCVRLFVCVRVSAWYDDIRFGTTNNNNKSITRMAMWRVTGR